MERTMSERSELVTRWRAALRRKGCAPATITSYLSRLRRFLDAFPEPFAVTGDDVEAWLDEVDHFGKTRYDSISALHAFYTWAIRSNLTTVDPTVMVERPRLKPGLPRPIHETDLAIALSLAGEADPRIEVAMLLAAGSGLRCCEIARLRWEDVRTDEVRVMGKGSRERVVPIPDATIDALADLDRPGTFVVHGWQSRGPAPGLRVSQECNAFLRSTGTTYRMHSLRHYAGTMAYQRGGRDIRAVQGLLGHASPATTAVYAALDAEALRPLVAAIPLPGRAPTRVA